jgi:hypothetical protein
LVTASVGERAVESAAAERRAETARAVALGDGTAGVPLYCWVQLEDGKALVSFDDAETLAAASRARRGSTAFRRRKPVFRA